MSPHWTESPNLSDTSGQYFTPLGKSRRSYSRARNFPDTHDMMVVFEMLEMDFILIFFFQVRSGQGEREGRLCTNYAHIQGQGRDKQGPAGTSRDKHGQAGTINERSGATVTSRTQLFQPTSAVMALWT